MSDAKPVQNVPVHVTELRGTSPRDSVRVDSRSRALLSRTRPAELQTNSLRSLAGWLASWLTPKLASQSLTADTVSDATKNETARTPVGRCRREEAGKCSPAADKLVFQTHYTARNRREGLGSEPHAPSALRRGALTARQTFTFD